MQPNIGGTWKELRELGVNIDGVWDPVTHEYCNIGGSWKTVWELNWPDDSGWVFEGSHYHIMWKGFMGTGHVHVTDGSYLRINRNINYENLSSLATKKKVDLTGIDSIDYKFAAIGDAGYNTATSSVDVSGLSGDHYIRVATIGSTDPGDHIKVHISVDSTTQQPASISDGDVNQGHNLLVDTAEKLGDIYVEYVKVVESV